MMNQLILVGRLISQPKKGYKIFTIAVTRQYKNIEGIYETDFVKFYTSDTVASKIIDFCNKGDLIGIRGRIETNENRSLKIVADRVTFLSTNRNGVTDYEE